MARPYETNDSVDRYFATIGITRLENYVRSNHPLRVLRPCGHEGNLSVSSIRSRISGGGGLDCAECVRAKRCAGIINNRASERRLIYRDVASELFDKGCLILSTEYNGFDKPVNYLCPKLHLVTTSLRLFREGKYLGCSECDPTSITELKVKAILIQRKCLYLSHLNSQISYLCPNLHLCKTSLSTFRKSSAQTNSCKKCVADSLRRTEEELELHLQRMNVSRRVGGGLKRQILNHQAGTAKLHSGKYHLAKQLLETLGPVPEGYQIDHIVPLSFFNPNITAEVEACWAIHNLRYLPWRENYVRHNRLSQSEFDSFTDAQVQILKLASLKPDYCREWLEIKS